MNTQYKNPLLISITNEMVKQYLPFPDVIKKILCFYREVLTKINVRQKRIVLAAHSGTQFDTPFLFENGIIKFHPKH